MATLVGRNKQRALRRMFNPRDPDDIRVHFSSLEHKCLVLHSDGTLNKAIDDISNQSMLQWISMNRPSASIIRHRVKRIFRA
ncbi:MAG: hypothetical protein GKR95_09385 [Gammaproteobacteria bacterium]|nr:hypothetical protein [Gammaproteobacteria bacterium]